jgi:hypothetical protein
MRSTHSFHRKMGPATSSAPTASNCAPLNTTHDFVRIGPENPRDPDEFRDIDAPLAPFELGYERLWLAQALGDFLLTEARALPCRPQVIEKRSVLGGERRSHLREPPATDGPVGSLNPNRIIPKWVWLI